MVGLSLDAPSVDSASLPLKTFKATVYLPKIVEYFPKVAGASFAYLDCPFAEIKDNERLQSIIKRHSLQPVENPDTVLYPSLESWYDSSGSDAPSPAPDRRATDQGNDNGTVNTRF